MCNKSEYWHIQMTLFVPEVIYFHHTGDITSHCPQHYIQPVWFHFIIIGFNIYSYVWLFHNVLIFSSFATVLNSYFPVRKTIATEADQVESDKSFETHYSQFSNTEKESAAAAAATTTPARDTVNAKWETFWWLPPCVDTPAVSLGRLHSQRRSLV